MPLYSYWCGHCFHEFDKLRKMADVDAAIACPKCNCDAMRSVSAASFRLAGKGWYETDFKTGTNKKNIKS